jgi:hypothetical protein
MQIHALACMRGPSSSFPERESVCVHVCMYINTCTFMHACTSSFTVANRSMFCVCVHAYNTHVLCMYTHTYACMHARPSPSFPLLSGAFVCVCVCVCVCVWIHMHTCTHSRSLLQLPVAILRDCVCARASVHMCLCVLHACMYYIYTSTHACMHACLVSSLLIDAR